MLGDVDRAAFLARVDAGPLGRDEAQQLTIGTFVEPSVVTDAVRTLRALHAVLPPRSPNHEREAQIIHEYREALIALALGLLK